MIGGKTIWLVANAASGSNDDASLDALGQACEAAGGLFARRIDFAAEDAPGPEELRSAGVDILAVFAGDGTINAIVSGLDGWEGAVLALPGGTMNLLARRLHGEADPAAIVARLAAGRGRRVRPWLVRSRHGDGLSGILAGPGAAWARVRETLRETDVLGAIGSAAGAIGESARGPKVHCREPACGRAEGYSAIQLLPTADGLAVDGYYAETFGDYARQGIALLRRNFREGPHDALGCHRSVRLACPEGEEMGLLIDGEPHAAAREETFTLAHSAVGFLATADGA